MNKKIHPFSTFYNQQIRVVHLILAFFIIQGCNSVEENIDEQRTKIHAYFPELTLNPKNLPKKELDWETALLMLNNNLILRNAQEKIIKAKVGVNRVFLDLIPQLTLQGIYTSAIKQMTELSSDNFNANINAIFQIPGIIQLRMNYYASMLACFSAQKQYELTYREEVLNLYSLFRTSDHLKRSKIIDTLQFSDPTISTMQHNEIEFKRNQETTKLWIGLSTALGCYSNQWVIITDHLPKINKLPTISDLKNPTKTGALFTTLQATELEGARLRELGIKFQYWPQLNMRVYSPSVYLFSGGNRGGFEFDSEDIRFETSVRMKLDTNLAIRDQLKEARRSTDLLRQKLYEDAQERMKKLLAAREAFALLQKQRIQLEAKQHLLKSLKKVADYNSFEKIRIEQLELMKNGLLLEKELDTLIPILWIVDESKWEKVIPPNNN